MSKEVSIQDVVDSHMCMGCGACAFAYSDQVTMTDTKTHGKRPLPVLNGTKACQTLDAKAICPGLGTAENDASRPDVEGEIPALKQRWGTVLEVWEGYACDAEIRFRGSSGGATTALALHAIEKRGMEGVIHTRASANAPLLNETVFSRSRDSLVEGSGSRYSPASPGEGLTHAVNAKSPCVFIGKPCDVEGATRARHLSVALDEKLGLTLAIFCAGTPSVAGTQALAHSLGAERPEHIESVRYRGNGWPGDMLVTYRDPETGTTKEGSTSYADGWGKVLQKYRQWRCHVCADHTGESADVSIGDPWYREITDGLPGQSLMIVRTEKGRSALRQAIEDGYIKAERRPAEVLDLSQPHLVKTQASIFGRSLACAVVGASRPKYGSWRRFVCWLGDSSLAEKVSSIAGTLKRIHRKRLLYPEQSAPLRDPN